MRSVMLTGNYTNLPIDIFALVISTVLLLGAASLAIKRLVE